MQPRKFQLPNNEWTRAFLATQGETNYVLVNDGRYIEVNVYVDEDLYKLGYGVARMEYEAKPEAFTIDKSDVPLLKKAIGIFEKRNLRKVDSFSFQKDPTEKELVQLTVKPTLGWILHSIYTIYGQLVQIRKNKKKNK